MKTLIPRFFLLGAVSAALVLASGCSAETSNAAPSPAPVASAPPAPATPVAIDNPTPVVTPAALPANIGPASPLASVVRLTQSGVDQSIIMVYVTNSSRTFNLDADKIIYLSDLGLPTELVRAMMQRDSQLQQEFATAQQAQQIQQTQPAPAAEPAPTETAQVAAAPAPVTVNYFNDTLSPYGNWVVVPGYGRCWQPTACAYDPNWQPYCDRGRWVYTDCGWYWSSDYAWGATFHYGRWFRDTSVGWCWYPDTVWAPSWVTWRYSDSYCGWAPLPPRTYCQSGVGIVYQSGNVSLGLNFGLGASCYTFVPTQYFCNSHPRNYCASSAQATQIYNNTTIINDIHVHGSGNNQIIINNGIPVQNVASTTQTPIRPVPVHQIDGGFVRGVHNRPSHTIGGDRANFTDNAVPSAQPSAPVASTTPPETRGAHGQPANHPGQVSGGDRANFNGQAESPAPVAATTPQNPPQRFGNNGNDNSRPAHFDNQNQNRFSPPVNNQAPQAQPGQWSSAPVRTQPERTPRPVAFVPQRPAQFGNDRPQNFAAPAPAPTANFNSNPQPAPSRWQQPQEAPHGNARNYEPRQNIIVQNQMAAPPVTYSTPSQPQPQAHSYSQPHNEPRQNYSPPPAMSAPRPSAPSVSAAPAPQPQSQGNGRNGNQNWTTR